MTYSLDKQIFKFKVTTGYTEPLKSPLSIFIVLVHFSAGTHVPFGTKLQVLIAYFIEN